MTFFKDFASSIPKVVAHQDRNMHKNSCIDPMTFSYSDKLYLTLKSMSINSLYLDDKLQ